MRRVVSVLLLIPVWSPAYAAEILFVNGRLVTGNPGLPEAQAMLVRDERIAAVGTAAQLRPVAGKNARIVDLKGHTVIPGLIDTHTHGLAWATSIVRGEIDLRYPKVRNIAGVQRLIAERAAKAPKGQWISGANWDDGKFDENRYPLRRDLDAAAPDHPVYLRHTTGHLAAVNSLALKLAGITAQTADPPGGLIDRDTQGEPTGIVKDNAMGIVDRVLPPESMEDRIVAIAYLSRACAEVGLTTINDVALLPRAIEAYQEAQKRGALKVRARLAPLVSTVADSSRLNGLGISTGFGNDWLKLGAAKIFTDGGMAARTIAIYPPPVANEPGNTGLLLWKPADLESVQMSLVERGWQLATHAIGDRAIDEALDSYEKVQRRFPNRDLRNRIIHAGVSTPKIQERMKRLNVLVDGNPAFVYFLGGHFERYGAQRVRWAYPAKSYLENGIIQSGGSDVYVTPLSPWWGIWSAVVRQEQTSGKVLAPEERITIQQALRIYTYNGAYSGFEEKLKGTLEPGKLADFVVLDRDVLSIPASEIKDVKVLSTWIGGELAYEGP